MKKLLAPIILAIIFSTSSLANASSTISYKSAIDAVKTLKVAPESRDGYARTKFTHWVNSDGNKLGCDARKAAIIRDAKIKPTIGNKCSLTGGKWLSVYDNVSIDKATSIDVDHMVPLAEAWDSGASSWTPEKRKIYANDLSDPRHLISVTAASNRSKSDRDPAEWLPTNTSYLCTYLSDWVSIKVRWSLTVDNKELDVLVSNLTKCPKKKLSLSMVQ